MLSTHEAETPPQFYIAARSSPNDERTRVLKYGRMFAVFNRFGDIESGGLGEQGLFFEGTRFLSGFVLNVADSDPLLLSSTAREDNCLFSADVTNVDLTRSGNVTIPRGAMHIARSKTLWHNTFYELIRISNYSLHEIRVPLAIRSAVDFADVFEVRGTQRNRRGTMLSPAISSQRIIFSYRGLDNVVRRTLIELRPNSS